MDTKEMSQVTVGRNRSWEISDRGKEWAKQWRTDNRDYIRQYSKDYARKKRVILKSGGIIQIDDKPPRPSDDICQLCEKEKEKLYYHHWDDVYPERGLWVCGLCHYGCEMAESGLIDFYNELKRVLAIGKEVIC